mgnify:CR=1 FL=1
MITDELRAWVTDHYSGWPSKKAEGYAIADRIDAGHRAALEKLAVAADEDRDGWVELPKDADGVPWHVGDVNENGRTITTMCLTAHGWHFSNIQNDINPSLHRHHQPDTWERIIEDALDGYHDTDFDKLVARCKALAGDAE